VLLHIHIDDNMSFTSSAGSLGSLMNQANQVLSDSDEECIVHEYMHANDDECLDSFDQIDLEYVRSQRGHRQGRRVLTWLFSGDILECMEDTHPIPSKRWSSLPQDVQDANWISFCRCRRPVFEELLATVWPHISDTQAVIPSHRPYSRRQKLLITVSYPSSNEYVINIQPQPTYRANATIPMPERDVSVLHGVGLSRFPCRRHHTICLELAPAYLKRCHMFQSSSITPSACSFDHAENVLCTMLNFACQKLSITCRYSISAMKQKGEAHHKQSHMSGQILRQGFPHGL
jgi:hypothetical protein